MKKTILIVENDHFVTKIWSRKLSKEYQVLVANSVMEGIQAVKSAPIDLIILDLRLNGPTSSGLQVYDFVRVSFLEIPILFITGLEFNEPLFVKAERAVKDDLSRNIKSQLIKKPIEIQTLVNNIVIALET